MIFPFSANKDTDCSIWRHVASRHISTRKYIRGFSPEIRFFQSFAFAKCTTIELFYQTSKTRKVLWLSRIFSCFFLNCKAILHRTLKFYPCKFTNLFFLYTYRWWLIHVYKRRVLADITSSKLFCLFYGIRSVCV